MLELVVAFVAGTGVMSLAVGTSWSRALTALHAVGGFTLVVLAPAKARGSVRTGMRRRRVTRWLSLLLAALVIVTIGLGFLHSTGIWYGVGYWSPLWTHMLLAFSLLAIFGWHVLSRPDRPTVADLDRRALLHGGGALAVAAVAYGVQEAAARAMGLPGATRRFTGSHEIGSYEPALMPTVSWINDRTPSSTVAADWHLDVAGAPVEIEHLWAMARPTEAALDCTGGWWSMQAWDAVPLSALLPHSRTRSIAVTSATGYSRLFPSGDADRLFLAVGYGGLPLRPSHGAPVRLVAPGRRGPWWVKWVRSIELDDRPWWLQVPFPLD
jgi:hypothetical protein